MTDLSTKLATQVIDAYSSGLDGLSTEECRSLDIGDAQCATLQEVLKIGPEGEVTQDERAKLATSGFSQDFIKTLAGDDGKNALHSRVRWLSGEITNWNFNLYLRQQKIYEIGLIGPDAKDAVPALLAVSTNYFECRFNACNDALVSLAKIGKAAVPALIEALRDSNVHIRVNATEALGKIGAGANDAVPELIIALNDVESVVRSYAATALGYIGKEAKTALSHLENMEQNDPLPSCRAWAKMARERIEAEIL